MPDAEACAPLFPERVHEGPACRDPDWDRVHRELARVGVTLKRLHEEHRDDARSKGEPFMSYDRFCKRYREFTVRKQAVSRVGHKAGRILEVDWAGPTMRLVDPATGEVSKVYLFVAFQAPALDERLPDGPDELFRGFLLEPMEARYGTASAVFCTQFRQKDRHAGLGGGVRADAIMGRIVHGAAWVGMGEMNMRRKLGAGSE